MNPRKILINSMDEKPDYKFIENKVTMLIKKAKLFPPIDLEQVVNYIKLNWDLKIFIEKSRTLSDEFEGIFIPRGDGLYGIMINDNKPLNRQRFTLAHELGHLVLLHEFHEPHFETFNGTSKNPLEIQANIFASNLLMPKSFLKLDVKNKSMNLEKLLLKYQVSKEAFQYRLPFVL